MFVDVFSGPKAGLSTAVKGKGLKATGYDKLFGQDVLTWTGFVNLALLILQIVEGGVLSLTD